MENFDVAMVGAGPGGSSAAVALSRSKAIRWRFWTKSHFQEKNSAAIS